MPIEQYGIDFIARKMRGWLRVLAVSEERRVAATMEEVTQYMEELRANHPTMSEEDLKDKGFTFLNDIRLACIKLTQGGTAGTA